VVVGERDNELLRLALRDPAAFCVFYERHAAELRGWLLGQVGSREVANDLTAEAFAQALLSMHRFRGRDPGSARAWLYAIARHLLIRYRQRLRVESAARRRLGMPITDYCDLDAADEQLDADALAPTMRDAVGELPAHEREALMLRIVHELSYREVADQLGIAVPAARMRVHRALTTLRLRITGARQ
jgi:RNA polymerase sigma-70 factor (ECF subfamily)